MIQWNQSSFIRFIIASLTGFLLAACNGSQEQSTSSTSPDTDKIKDEIAAPFNMNQYKINQIVCDPMSEHNENEDPKLGVRAQLYWLAAGDRYYDVNEYIEFGIEAEEDLFFSSVNVPTRRFEIGFPKETGDLIQNDLGEDLIEYFALRFDGEIQLSSEDEEGWYELGILSDDGTILKLNLDEELGLQTVIDNNGDHPTRFGCSDQALINLSQGQKIPFVLDYYQGPRNHISNMLLWRKVDVGHSAGNDPLCGVQGNHKYFDPDNNSDPKQGYLDLQARGWKPLESGNFAIKEDDSHNPCNQGVAPIISNFKVEEDLDYGINVSWETDIYATSQVRIVNQNTGEETITDSDNVLRKVHFVRIFPEQNVPLIIQAVSVSESLGKAISEPITIVWE